MQNALLTKEQSNFLKRINEKDIFLNALNSEDRNIARFLKDLSYIKQVQDVDNNYLKITESGKMYLDFEKSYYEEQKRLDEELESLKQMANSAKKQSQESEKDAKFSKKVAIFSLLISLAAVIIQIVELID